jgi:hypothetical protein
MLGRPVKAPIHWRGLALAALGLALVNCRELAGLGTCLLSARHLEFGRRCLERPPPSGLIRNMDSYAYNHTPETNTPENNPTTPESEIWEWEVDEYHLFNELMALKEQGKLDPLREIELENPRDFFSLKGPPMWPKPKPRLE